MLKSLVLAALATLALPVHASVICAGCEYPDGAAGGYLGAYDGARHDLGTFQDSQVPLRGRFDEFWVFDIAPLSLASASADFTLLAAINGFFGELYRDAGSVCGAVTCSSIATGALIGHDDAANERWEIFSALNPGRYVLHVSGLPNPINGGAYTGQLSFLAFTSVNEAGGLGLMLGGLMLMAVGQWFDPRRRKR